MFYFIFKITNYFNKNKKTSVSQEGVYLDKWERLKQLPDPYIGDIFIEGKINDIAMALVHCDQKTRNRFIEFSKSFTKYRNLEKIIEKNANVPKNISDKMKAHVSNLSGLNKKGYIQFTRKSI